MNADQCDYIGNAGVRCELGVGHTSDHAGRAKSSKGTIYWTAWVEEEMPNDLRSKLFWHQLKTAGTEIDKWPDYLKRIMGVSR